MVIDHSGQGKRQVHHLEHEAQLVAVQAWGGGWESWRGGGDL